MDIRYGCNQRDVKRYDTGELRREFLVERLFAPGEALGAYSHADRMIAMGVMPAGKAIRLDKCLDCRKTLGSEFFLAGRELGIINIGGPGVVGVDGTEYRLERIEGLYVSLGTREVEFKAENPGQPPKFYLASTPAHRSCPITHIPFAKAIHRELGAQETANARAINQFIHPDVLETCQLSMGVTILRPGSVWNTMPTHTHERRMEVYLYFDIAGDDAVFHLMGEPGETRHLVVKNEQAVISPSWSIHSGCGTANYAFIWSMAGENKIFDDMDACPAASLR